ncbi:MAG: V-type ATP synthase subunit F [Thermoplasmata archaeon]|nr:V-type ATP synthase subunit F [Thermoplasmata archaeon]
MEIAVVGTQAFTLGFQLAGITKIMNPQNEEEMQADLQQLLNDKEVGIVVIDSSDLLGLPERLRNQLSDSISPTFLGIGTEQDNTLREQIKSAIGVDLWKK